MILKGIDTMVLYLPKDSFIKIGKNNYPPFSQRKNIIIQKFSWGQFIQSSREMQLYHYLKFSVTKLLCGKNYGTSYHSYDLLQILEKLGQRLLEDGFQVDFKKVICKRIDMFTDYYGKVDFEELKALAPFLKIKSQSSIFGQFFNNNFSSIYFQNQSKTLVVYNKTKEVYDKSRVLLPYNITRFEYRLKTSKKIFREFQTTNIWDLAFSHENIFQKLSSVFKHELYFMFDKIIFKVNELAKLSDSEILVNEYGVYELLRNSKVSNNRINQKEIYRLKRKYLKYEKLLFCYSRENSLFHLLKNAIDMREILQYIGIRDFYNNYSNYNRIINKKVSIPCLY